MQSSTTLVTAACDVGAIISRMPLLVCTKKQALISKHNNCIRHGEEPLHFHVPEDETGYVCIDNGANVLLEGSH